MPWFSDMSGSAAKATMAAEAAESFYASAENAGEGTTSAAPDNAMNERSLGAEVPVIVFANEFFDALPVEILSQQGALRISTQDGRSSRPGRDHRRNNWHFSIATEFIQSRESASRFHCWHAVTCHALRHLCSTGLIIAIDYGYTRQEQLAGRHRGTLMAYRQHFQHVPILTKARANRTSPHM